MSRKSVILFAMLVASSRAFAQQPGAAPDLDTQQAANAQAEYTAAVIAFRKKEQDMAAYLTACRDKPGCTVPIV